MKKLLYSLSSMLLGIFLLSTTSVVMGQTPSISVVQPNGGEAWVVGTSHLISWNDNLSKPVMIVLSTDGGLNYSDTLTHSVSGTTWGWDIPTTQDTSSQCMIKIVSTTTSSIYATSDAFFALKATQPADSNAIIQPNGGEKWAVGTSHLISWTNYVSKAAVQLSIDGGKTYTTLTGADSISGSTFTWNIPTSQTTSDSCLIKLVEIHDTSVPVQSDSLFSIVATPSTGSIRLLQPSDTGISWKRGTEHLISWSDNFKDSVKIVLLHNGTPYSVLSTNAYGSGYAWTISDTVKGDSTYKIAVYNAVNNAIGDTSNNKFTIDTTAGGGSTAAKTITLVQPDTTAVNWAWNTYHLISWYDNFSDPVKVELLINKNYYITLAANVTGNGYTWSIPNTIPVGSNYKIKVANANDTTVSDTSSVTFSVLATPLGSKIKLVQPNGGEQWARGEEHLISWYSNFSDSVKVELWKGGLFYSVLDSRNADNGYGWTIPNTLPADTDYRVRVLNAVDSTVYDESDSSFAILAHKLGDTITLAQPNGGEQWALGEEHLISWYSNFKSPVKVELYYQGAFQTVLDSSNTENRYVWTVPSNMTPDTGYRVKVLNVNDTTINDVSDSSFTILAHKLGESITLVQPIGGEKWVLGTEHLISWLDNFDNPVKVELYKDGSFLTVLDSSNSGNSYTWKISSALTADTGYRIKILNTADTTITAESDSSFTLLKHALNEKIVLVQPNGGESWARNTEHLISWYSDFPDPIRVELYKNNTFLTVLDSSNTENRLAWKVPNDLAADTGYRIKVFNTADTTVADSSDSSFTVLVHPAETMTVVQPNGGEVWARGTAHLVSWSANFQDTAKVELYRNKVLYAILDTAATDNRYVWTISNSIPLDSTYTIKILNKADTTVGDVSDTTFSVVAFVPGGEVKVIQPNLPGTQWARGTAHLISWTDNVKEPVDIYLIDTAAVSPLDTTLIASNVDGSTYTWDIPKTQTLSTGYKVKVSSSLQKDVFDVSDTTFSIVAYVPGGEIKVLQPNRGEKWQLGSAHLISWTDNLTESVNIFLIDTITADTTAIASNVDGSTYAWTISDTLTAGSGYKIKVASSLQKNISDVSDSTFSLTKYASGHTITLIQPNGGDYWTPKSTNLISWSSNFVDTVKIELYHANTLYAVLDSNVTENRYAWTVSDTIPYDSTYKIKILNMSDSTIADESDTTFSITNAPPGGEITVNQPNGGETWYQGQQYLISWDGNLAQLNGDNYDILLVHYDYTTGLPDQVDTLVKNQAPSTYTWTVPAGQLADTTYRIKIIGHILTGVADSSDSYFTIAAPAKVAPMGVSIYPNPSTDFVTFQAPKTSSNFNYLVTVYNRYGTRIWKGFLNTANSNDLRFTTYDLPNGIYFVTLSGGPRPLSQIFIVQH